MEDWDRVVPETLHSFSDTHNILALKVADAFVDVLLLVCFLTCSYVTILFFIGAV